MLHDSERSCCLLSRRHLMCLAGLRSPRANTTAASWCTRQWCGGDIRYKVLWIGEIAKHKGIGETKVLQGKEKAKVLWIYWLP